MQKIRYYIKGLNVKATIYSEYLKGCITFDILNNPVCVIETRGNQKYSLAMHRRTGTNNWAIVTANVNMNMFKDKLGITLPKDCPLSLLTLEGIKYPLNTECINELQEVGIFNKTGRITKVNNCLFFTELAQGKVVQSKCTCDIMVLMRAGCQCGFINTERGV